MKVVLKEKKETVPLNTLGVGDGFTYNGVPYMRIRHGTNFSGKISNVRPSEKIVLNLSTSSIVSLDGNSEVIPKIFVCTEE